MENIRTIGIKQDNKTPNITFIIHRINSESKVNCSYIYFGFPINKKELKSY